MRFHPSLLAFIAGVVVMTGCAISWTPAIGPAVSSVLFTLAGFVTAFSIPFLPDIRPFPVVLSRREAWALPAVACGMMLSYHLSARIMDASPLRYEDADMIPIMQAMARRFLAGDWSSVYDTVKEVWSGVQPIYLPFLWIPFAAADVFDFDPRWVTVSGIWVAACVVILFVDLRRGLLGWLILYLLFILMRHLHIDPSHNVIRLTEEGVVYAWYALLAWALASRSDLMLGLAFSACLFSRFSMAGAVPAILLYRALQGRWKSLLQTAAVPAFLSGLAVLAFGLRTLMPFTSLPAKYIAYAKWVWRKNPEYMTEGLGLAKFFGPDRITLQHSLLVWTALLLPSAAAVLAWQVGRRRPGGLPNMDLALTTLALTCFHALIVVPYQYLYFTPVFFALASAAIVQSGRNPPR